MKVKDLLEDINRSLEEYGKDFLQWEVYTEQITEADKKCKRDGCQKGWGIIHDDDDWEYFECAGFWTKFTKKKIFTVNVNY